jgi:hypothetical protein
MRNTSRDLAGSESCDEGWCFFSGFFVIGLDSWGGDVLHGCLRLASADTDVRGGDGWTEFMFMKTW